MGHACNAWVSHAIMSTLTMSGFGAAPCRVPVMGRRAPSIHTLIMLVRHQCASIFRCLEARWSRQRLARLLLPTTPGKGPEGGLRSLHRDGGGGGRQPRASVANGPNAVSQRNDVAEADRIASSGTVAAPAAAAAASPIAKPLRVRPTNKVRLDELCASLYPQYSRKLLASWILQGGQSCMTLRGAVGLLSWTPYAHAVQDVYPPR